MSYIRVDITIGDGNDGIINGLDFSGVVNNVSKPKDSELNKNNGRYGKTFATGSVPIVNGYLGFPNTKLQSEVDRYDGLMFGATNDNGEYPITINVSGVDLDRIILYGDRDAQQFPTKVRVDDNDIFYSDDYIFAIKFNTISSTHKIEVLEWSKPLYNACITYIEAMPNTLSFNQGWVDSVDSLSQSTQSGSEINYGGLSNSGNLNIRDINGEIKDYINDGLITADVLPVQVYIGDNLVQTHITNDSYYNERDTLLNLSLTNDLSEWDTLIYAGRPLSSSMNLYELFKEIMLTLNYSTSDIDSMISSNIIYGDDNQIGSIKEYMELINIEYPYLESDTYRETIDNICTLAQLNYFVNDNNDLKFISARPVIIESEKDNAVVINDTYLQEDLEKTLILRNKISKVDIVESETSYGFNSIENGTFNLYSQRAVQDKIVNGISYPVYSRTDYSRYGFSYNASGDGGDKYNSGFNVLNVNIPFYGGFNSVHTFGKIPVKLTTDSKYISPVLATDVNLILRGDSSQLLDNDFMMIRKGTLDFGKLSVPFIANSEHEIKDKWFNLDSSGKPISMKGVTTFGYAILIKDYGYDLYFVFRNAVIINDQSSLYNDMNTYLMFFSGEYDVLHKTLMHEEKDKTFGDITGLTSLSISSIELMQNNTAYKSKNISMLISDNILSDYKNGISSGTCTIFTGNYYNNNKDLIIDWSNNSEIIQVGQIVKFYSATNLDNSSKYWRVIGRNFRWNGAPMVDLQLQEVKVIT